MPKEISFDFISMPPSIVSIVTYMPTNFTFPFQKPWYQPCCFSLETPYQVFSKGINKMFYKILKPVKYMFRDVFIH